MNIAVKILRVPVFAVLGFVVLFGIVGIFNSCSESDNQTTAVAKPVIERDDIEIVTERIVRDKLKSPSTASFPQHFNAEKKNGKWTVVGVVDAQNSYGAMLRQNFLVEIVSVGDKWKALKVSIY